MSMRKLLFALDPLGPLSPLNPRHPLNPLRPLVVERCPPLGELDGNHASLLTRLYGDRPPFPNMEWWWNAIDLETKGGKFSILTNVHAFAVPVTGLVVQGTVAIRDLKRKQSHQAHATGTLDPGPSGRFTANGWHLRRENGEYSIDVQTPDLTTSIVIEQGPVVLFNDPELPRGWYDNNPDGAIPYWASYRSRFSRAVTGTFEVHGNSYKITGGHARFDHQSVHWSGRDVRSRSAVTLAEALITRPKWLWYHARLNDNFNLVAYEIRNGHTEAVMKRAAALCDDTGKVQIAEPGSVVFQQSPERVAGRVSAPRVMNIQFDVPRFSRTTGVEGRRCEVVFTCRQDQGWTVNYPIIGPVSYEAQEVIGDVKSPGNSKSVYWNGAWHAVTKGQGTLEVLDMLGSVGFGG